MRIGSLITLAIAEPRRVTRRNASLTLSQYAQVIEGEQLACDRSLESVLTRCLYP